ncbi:C1 family peptidase [Pseudomonas sp. HY7a-MNA-CIBAN-0227]|uniref:C1 family peptidase n=1 Tax=Pseudomonas sp. HY7a-MNA-CIBAN-0227 TaxID=3140474 RepID=UPI003326D779
MPKLTNTAISSVLPSSKGRTFGWLPPEPVINKQLDIEFDLELGALPESVDLRSFAPPIYSQGPYNTCTSNAVAALIEMLRRKLTYHKVSPSRMFIYWYSRVISNTQSGDNGTSVSAAIQAIAERGYCDEQLWQYTRSHINEPPTAGVIAEADSYKANTSKSLQTLGGIRSSLADGYAVAFGLRIHNSFFDADLNGGFVPVPDPDTASIGHAGLLVGYDDISSLLIMRNSWGTQTADGNPCGDGGYYYLPYEFVTNAIASDFWSIVSTENGAPKN